MLATGLDVDRDPHRAGVGTGVFGFEIENAVYSPDGFTAKYVARAT